MSKEKKNTQNEKRKLSRQERKQIDTLIRQAKGDGKPHTAQDSIPFERMYKDGICRLANGRYSKCIEFEDINYQLAQPDDKTAIFEALCDMYNSFDASISVQLSLISRHANKDDFKNSITIAPQNDDFDSIRAEYTEMLRTQLERGNNGLIKTKFLTFTVEAKDIRSARARLARIETDTLNHFKVIGAAARVLDGKQRLEVLHGIFHPDGERFNFAWEWLPASGLSVKDFIAPSSFRFGDGRMFQMGGKFGVVSFLQIVAPELSDRMLADFMDAENGIIVNLHIQSIDHNEAIKTIKRKITDLDRMKIEEQKKAIRSGYDMDIIPSDLATYGGEAKNLLRDLQSRNERMFLLTLLVLNLADTKQKLDNEVFGAAAIAQKYNCILTRLDYRQEQGLMSSIPLGENLIHIQRGLTTSSTAVFVPFTVQELFQSGEALYYGLNALSNNMILCDRKKLKNPNGLILGTPGSGLIASSYLSEDADITGAESAYAAMEAELQDMLNNIEREYPGYDEYRVNADEIEHDPYVLISILSALHEGVFTLDEAQSTLEMLFEKQYILTVEEEVQVRYRTETRTDSEGNEYEVEVPYNYYILHVDLENFNLSHVPVYIMGEEQLSMYAMYMSSLGNRPDLFPSSGYVSKYYENPPADYEVPAALLNSDEQFARLIEEADKYVGFPYVWGGSTPETSFDCSGFVSYVLTNSGLYNTGRLGAQGLYNISTRVSNPQPGDLVFFTGTYDTPGVSHVGIYVGEDGDGSPVMLHCGDPIQYAKLDTSYWQSHFYAYGRLHYN
ncbi:hypothetical protein K380107A5_12240 [Holdemania massiliensis]|uniref:VirB4-like conjugal transfer ATPase, CD1110 family n=1 Tax=Holdemania massiliensis TaxID=1468449 RepID=UPI0036F2D1BC